MFWFSFVYRGIASGGRNAAAAAVVDEAAKADRPPSQSEMQSVPRNTVGSQAAAQQLGKTTLWRWR